MTASMTVGSYMNTQATAVSSGVTLNEVIQKLADDKTTGAAVIDNKESLIGFVSEQDCLKHVLLDSYHCGTPTLVDTVMRMTPVETVNPNDSILDLAVRLGDSLKVYPVVEGGSLVGVISLREVLQALIQNPEKCGAW